LTAALQDLLIGPRITIILANYYFWNQQVDSQ
jgi:hypothetical protein